MFCKPNPPPTSIENARAFVRKQVSSNIRVDLSLHELRPVVGRSFGGKTIDDCENMIAYIMPSLGDDLNDKDRQDVAGYLLGFFVHEIIRKGGLSYGITGQRNGDGNDDDDGGDFIKSIVVFREYDPNKENHKPNLFNKIGDIVLAIRAYMKMKFDPVGLPAILEDSSKNRNLQKASSKLLQPVAGTMHEWHCQYAPQKKHWYVAVVASDPDCQGQGYGKKVMGLLGQCADEVGMACYLESPDYNRIFYEKCGYSVVKAVDVTLTDKDLGKLSAPGYLMVREPNQPNQ